MTAIAHLTAACITGAAKALTGARSLWSGCAPVPQQRIYFANHTSHSDFVLLWASLPPLLRRRTRPVAGADYWESSAIKRYVIHEVFHGVLVDRTGQAQAAPASAVSAENTENAENTESVESMEGAEGTENAADAADAPGIPTTPPRHDALAPLQQALDAGDSLILFPEGTRNMNETGLLPFKSGIYHLARANPQVEIVPVWLDNLSRVMPKGALIPLPLLCTVHFGEPLQVQEGEEKQDFLDRARDALLALAHKESPEKVQDQAEKDAMRDAAEQAAQNLAAEPATQEGQP